MSKEQVRTHQHLPENNGPKYRLKINLVKYMIEDETKSINQPHKKNDTNKVDIPQNL